MSPNKEETKEIELTGKVIKGSFSKGSKSEDPNALFIETADSKFKLRLIGGKAFGDPTLPKYVGKSITAKGILDNRTFFVNKSAIKVKK